MNRRRRKQKQKHQRRKEADQRKVKVWESYLRAGETEREVYDQQAKENLDYYHGRHEEQFKKLLQAFTQLQPGQAIKVNKAAQIRAVLGPKVYQQNPTRQINARITDSVSKAMAAVMRSYVNYTPNETNLRRELRKAIDDSLMRGRGFMQTGFDDSRELVTSWAVPSNQVVIDPDATSLEDAYWVAVRHVRPLWEVRDEIEPWRAKGLKANAKGKAGSTAEDDDTELEAQEAEDELNAGGTNELVAYYEVWSKMGNGLDRGIEADNQDATSDDWVRLWIKPGHHCPLLEGEWDAPLYFDDEWPLVALDLVAPIDQLWPTSLMEQARQHIRALDVLATLSLHLAKIHAREIYFVSSKLSTQVIAKIENGPPTTVVHVPHQSGQLLRDMIQRFDTGQGKYDVVQAMQWHERELGMITGLLDVLTGQTALQAQERSATAVQQKQNAVNDRLQDLVDLVEEFCSRLARNEALTIRLPGPVDAEDVAEVVRDVDLGWLVSLKIPEEVPVRTRQSDRELARLGRQYLQLTGQPAKGVPDDELVQIARDADMAEIALDVLVPQVADYYATKEQAELALQFVVGIPAQPGGVDPATGMEIPPAPAVPGALEDMAQQGNAMAGRVLRALSNGGSVSVRPVTVEDVWRDTAGITSRELVRELDYDVVAGSTKKLGPERMGEIADTMISQFLPILAQNADYANMQKVMDFAQEAMGLPVDKRITLNPPPAPAPEGAPA